MSIGLSPAALERLRTADLVRPLGKVSQVLGLALEVTGLVASIGELCEVRSEGETLAAEVVGFRADRLLLMPLGDLSGVRAGAIVTATGEPVALGVSEALLGRVIDAFGRPVDGGPALPAGIRRSIHRKPPPALERRRINEPLETGIRVIDGLLPVGRGQRIGIFAGSGVGKSVLLGSLARHASADANVIALVGERGREVREFVERDLGADGLARSVVVVATSDEPPLVRRQAAFAATTIAEHFRDRGNAVLLMMDSVTRFAMAQREIGLAVGEPPATRGYPPSVFALCPKLLERAGTTAHAGSITALYTVLVEGDDMMDPVGDTVRSILDGHIVLSRDLAGAGHFPAVDVLGSVSRLTSDVLSKEEARAGSVLRAHLSAWRDVRDLVNIGAYSRGTDQAIDRTLDLLPGINGFLRQDRDERTARAETLRQLASLAGSGVKS